MHLGSPGSCGEVSSVDMWGAALPLGKLFSKSYLPSPLENLGMSLVFC